jgi:flagellin
MNINTNIASISTRNYMRQTNLKMETVMERLSSGLRINNAGDDAAGLAISTKMTSIIRGLDTATRNSNDGISLLQTAESALGSITNVLQRIRELAVQADNDTYNATDKQSLQDEIDELLKEIDHVGQTTEFNGVKLLDGTVTQINLHISHLATDIESIALMQADTAAAGLNLSSATNVDVTTDAQLAITTIDAALNSVSAWRADFGAMLNRLNYTIDNLSVTSKNTQGARSRIEDADMSLEYSEMTKNRILLQSGMSMLTQANQQPQMILQLLQQ